MSAPAAWLIVQASAALARQNAVLAMQAELPPGRELLRYRDLGEVTLRGKRHAIRTSEVVP